MSRRMGLGRGLDAFFSDSAAKNKKEETASQETEKTTGTGNTTETEKTRKTKKLTGTKRKTAEEPIGKRHQADGEERKQTERQAGLKAEEKSASQRVDGHPDNAKMIALDLIDANIEQPRQHFEELELAELAESIRRYGVLQPLLLTARGDRYQIIAGERRYRAAKLAGLTEVPAIIHKLNRQETMEVSLIENIQRADLNAMEEARAYQTLMEEFKLTQEEIAARVAKSRVTITNSVRLLKLAPAVQSMVAEGQLSGGHARALLGINDTRMQEKAAASVVNRGLSVRETERLVRQLTAEKKTKDVYEPEERIRLFFQELEEQLREKMGTKVLIRQKDEKQGRIEIEYYSQEELERISELLASIRE